MNSKAYISLIVFLLFFCAKGSAQFCSTPPSPQVSWSCSTANIFWGTLPNAVLYEYRIDSAGTVKAQGNTASNNAFVNGLSQSTVYIAWLRAICGAGDTSGWAPHTFITPACPGCKTPEWISAVAVGCDSLTISWDSVATASSYEFAITLNASAPSSGWMSSGITTIGQGGLLDDTVYYVHVKANCGTDGYSTVQSVSVTIPKCPTPNSVGLVSRSFDGVISPNPANRFVSIVLSENPKEAILNLFDLTGRTVLSYRPTERMSRISLEHLPAGTYLLEYRDNEKRKTFPFIKL